MSTSSGSSEPCGWPPAVVDKGGSGRNGELADASVRGDWVSLDECAGKMRHLLEMIEVKLTGLRGAAAEGSDLVQPGRSAGEDLRLATFSAQACLLLSR